MNKQRGTTLIELMLVISILGILITIGPNLYIQIRRFFFLNTARLELQRDARAVMYDVTRRMHQARSSTIVIDQASGQPYYSRMSFTDIDGKNYKFYQNGTNFIMVDSSTRTLAQNLRYLAFAIPRSEDMGIISVSFTLERNTYEGRTKALHMASEKVRIMN